MARPHPPSLARFGVAATTAPPPELALLRRLPSPPSPRVLLPLLVAVLRRSRPCRPRARVPRPPRLGRPGRRPPPSATLELAGGHRSGEGRWAQSGGGSRRRAKRRRCVQSECGASPDSGCSSSARPIARCLRACILDQLLYGLSAARDINKIQALLDEMKRKNVAGDVFFYTAVINAYCRAGNVRRASEVFDECVGNSIEPNEHTYGAVINGFCKIGQMEAAEMLLADMQARGVINRVRSLE